MWGPSYDLLMRPLERWSLRRLRAQLLGEARGRVLELGIGTGLNVPHYPVSVEVVGIDPQPSMRRRAGQRACGTRVKVRQGDAQALEFEDASFDTVAATLVFCSVEDDAAALREACRVLKPGGRLLLLEHVRPPGALGRAADVLTPVWRLFSGGCRLNRDPKPALARLGLVLERERRFWGSVGRLWVWRKPNN